MAILDGKTITEFLAKMSVDHDEQKSYFLNPGLYITSLKNIPLATPQMPNGRQMPDSKVNILLAAAQSGNLYSPDVQNEMNSEKVAGHTDLHKYWSATVMVLVYGFALGQAISDSIIHLIRQEIDQRMGRR